LYDKDLAGRGRVDETRGCKSSVVTSLLEKKVRSQGGMESLPEVTGRHFHGESLCPRKRKKQDNSKQIAQSKYRAIHQRNF